jgi:hypothetical protein
LIDDFVQNKICLQTVAVPHGKDGSASQAIIILDHIITGAKQAHAMTLCRESLDWISGTLFGMGNIRLAIHFEQPIKT